MSSLFSLKSPYSPAGDQPQAIRTLAERFEAGEQYQTLLGVTGSGKTFTVANLIAQRNRPTLILTHNKTLAAQLYQEFKEFFPDNAVEYFISYYDYYQPEAYVVSSDTFIEKDASINDEIEKLRMRATTSLLTRRDTIVVASVSCIYGLGSPATYKEMMIPLKVGQFVRRDQLLRQLVDIQYDRNDYELQRSTFRVRGDVVDIIPAYEEWILRIEFFGDEVERISRVELTTGRLIQELHETMIAPAKHFITHQDDIPRIVRDIRSELKERLEELEGQGKLLEAQRLEQRVNNDAEMIQEAGFCNGIENYSRIIDNREAGSRPNTLIDYFGEEWFLVIDESHVTLPQVRGMYNGDQQRKKTLVEYGFRLPSALDNRPMSFEEFEASNPSNVLYLSATPGDFEIQRTHGVVVEQIIRPTGLLDPTVELHPTTGQMEHLLKQIREVRTRGERILITTLTKKMAERLTEFLTEMDERVRYLHSEIDSLERTEIIRALRMGEFDTLVGINLLREGLDLPEVSLVAILDADKEGFLRSYRSLIQTMGRASRNVNGKVLLYADHVTDSMRLAVEETTRRRELQSQHNREHGITPRSVERELGAQIALASPADVEVKKGRTEKRRGTSSVMRFRDVVSEAEEAWLQQEGRDFESERWTIAEAEEKMLAASAVLNFEEAAKWRDLMVRLAQKEGSES